MKLMIDQLIEGIRKTGNPTCVGLDTQLGHLPEGFAGSVESFEDAAAAILRYNKALVDALCGIVPSVKVQIAYYEMYGVPGMQAFVDTCAYAKSKGLVVIGDAKRNDIGATSGAYANAFLGETPLGDKTQSAFPVDFVTVNAYLGSDGILPFLKASEVRGGGIFALVKTSNPSGVELQDLMIGDRHVYEVMGDLVSKWGESCIGLHGYSSVGAVVGATYPEQGAALRVRLKPGPFHRCARVLFRGHPVRQAADGLLPGIQHQVHRVHAFQTQQRVADRRAHQRQFLLGFQIGQIHGQIHRHNAAGFFQPGQLRSLGSRGNPVFPRGM